MAERAGAASVAAGEIDMSNPAATGGGENQTLVGYGPREGPQAAARRGRRALPPRPGPPRSSAPGRVRAGRRGSPPTWWRPTSLPFPRPRLPPAGRAAVRVLAKPPVRKLAKDLGVDLAHADPDRSRGTVTREDVSPRRRARSCRELRPPRRHHGRPGGGDPRADQGRAEDDGAGHGRLRVHGPARHRVGHRRRDQDDEARRAAQVAATSARSRCPRFVIAPILLPPW